MLPPIKIKIGDHDKQMRLQYEDQKVRVKQANGKIVIKDKKNISITDTILEYLSNYYISPIIIKLFDIDIVYVSIVTLRLIFDYVSKIKTEDTTIIAQMKFRPKLRFIHRIYETLNTVMGRPVWKLKWFSSIVLALDIFKVDGLKGVVKIKQTAKGLQKYFERLSSKFKTRQQIINSTISFPSEYEPQKLIIKQNVDRPIVCCYAVLQDNAYKRIRDIKEETTIEDVGDKTLEEALWGTPLHTYFYAVIE